MIHTFDDFCTWMFVTIDDCWQQVAPLFVGRPGPAPACSDSEVITMALVGECRGWDTETQLMQEWHDRPELFPHIPERTRFNRRRRNLMQAINLIRRVILQVLDVAQDRQCVIDSLPVPVVQFHLVPSASREWAMHDAAFGKVPTKKQTIYGYKLHLLVTVSGVIRDFELAPANEADLTVAQELLAQHTDLDVIGDKAYVSAPVQADLLAQQRVRLRCLPRANHKRQVSPAVRRALNQARQIIETDNGQLVEQCTIQTNHATSFWGLCARLSTKLTAHTLCVYLNRVLGIPTFLQIKALAFPHMI